MPPDPAPDPRPLVRFSESDLALEHPSDDIRGRIVVDRNGYGLGSVEDLLVDADERRVRFIVVRGSSILFGEKTPVIPIDMIRRGDRDYVWIIDNHEHIEAGPGFDPELASDSEFQSSIYDWYGFTPYWDPDYVYPAGWSRGWGGRWRRKPIPPPGGVEPN